VAKLVWRVKLVAELQPGVTTETEVARIERTEEAGLAELGRWCKNTVWVASPLGFASYLIRTEIGIPRPVILLSVLQAIFASIC
jgi:hypothetical protein